MLLRPMFVLNGPRTAKWYQISLSWPKRSQRNVTGWPYSEDDEIASSSSERVYVFV